jgi:hypothetical protein
MCFQTGEPDPFLAFKARLQESQTGHFSRQTKKMCDLSGAQKAKKEKRK